MRTKSILSGLSASLFATLGATAAFAQSKSDEIVGAPVDGAIGFQPAVTELMQEIVWLNGFLTILCFAIVGFVAALMLWVMVRHNARANKEPATFSHNTPIEVAWTIIPIFILVVIGAFSLPVLWKQQEIPEGDIYIKATGYQWYWGYEYVDEGFAFDSYMIGQPATGGNYMLTEAVEAQLVEAGYSASEFLLATDTAVVVPVNKTIVMGITGADVIHAWTIPAFGVKQDAVPGRVAELWFKAEREGTYFGQCSELCGKDHAYMPITVKVVSEEEYAEWLASAKQEYASLDTVVPAIQVASAE